MLGAGQQQPAELREYFRQRLEYYRNESKRYPGGSDPVYQKEEVKG
ncbi:DNA polymerase III subunit theta [Klebsiella pneumoniae]